MQKLQIVGGEKLYGDLVIPSAKNAFLPILAATILCEGKVTLHNNPRFVDIFNMCGVLEDLGSKIRYVGDDIIIDNSNLSSFEISAKKASTVRSSIFSLGSIIGRFRRAKVAYPGGCEIGARPIDIHLRGLESLSVLVSDRHGLLFCEAKKLRGAEIHLDFPSVGATENVMMAAVLAEGETRIYNPAKEPEIIDLQNFLNVLGAKITGAGGECIKIVGVKALKKDVEYTPMFDRIIAGTYALMAANCGGEVVLQNVKREYVGSFLSKIQNSNCKLYYEGDTLIIKSDGNLDAVTKIETAPYPGFPTDMQEQMVASLATSSGTSIMVENLFENRFKLVPELIKMGAKITVKDNIAVIVGVPTLYGADVHTFDLRGGAALVLAGLRAKGYTTISNIELIDRGYYKIENDLTKLGAKIKRINSE